jgi:hypothetical protein
MKNRNSPALTQGYDQATPHLITMLGLATGKVRLPQILWERDSAVLKQLVRFTPMSFSKIPADVAVA